MNWNKAGTYVINIEIIYKKFESKMLYMFGWDPKMGDAPHVYFNHDPELL